MLRPHLFVVPDALFEGLEQETPPAEAIDNQRRTGCRLRASSSEGRKPKLCPRSDARGAV